MSGGGKGQVAPTNSEAVVGSMPAYMNRVSPMNIPAGMPGQLPALAAQLGAGFGVAPKSFSDYLAKIYTAPQTIDTRAMGAGPAKVAPKVKPKPGPVSPLNLVKPGTAGGKNAR